jgi:hypothetical protein
MDSALTLKAGILPFYNNIESGEIKYLIAKPKPVRNLSDSVPFAIARGTRRVKSESGEMVDIRDEDTLAYAENNIDKIEPLWQTALAEAEEELGLIKDNITQIYDIGVLQYKDYGIHFFSCEVKNLDDLIEAKDSKAVMWATEQEIYKMAEDGDFNKKYIPIFESIKTILDKIN